MRLVRFAACLLSSVAVGGCSLADEVEIFNNTGSGFEVHACNSTQRVGDGLTFSIYSYCRGAIELRFTTETWRFTERMDSNVIRRFGTATGVGNYKLRLQVQGDGTVRVVPPDTPFPATKLGDQPEGFPPLHRTVERSR